MGQLAFVMTGHNQSQWFQGLLFAERVGPVEAEFLLNTHEFCHSGDFENGVVDYLNHKKHCLSREPRSTDHGS